MSETPIADMVQHMLSAEISAESILLAIRAVELTTRASITVDPVTAMRRAKDRERKRVKAFRLSADTKSGDSISSIPSVDLENKKKKKERKSGNICPRNFHPTEEHYQLGQSLNHPRNSVDSMCDDMKAWSEANANRAIARKADWNLTFTGWIKRTSTKTNGGSRENRGHSLAAAADDLIARAESFERENDVGERHDAEPEFTIGQTARR